MELHEATSAQLIAELQKRCPAGVVIVATPDDNNTSDTRRHYWGSRPWCIGVSHTLRNELTDKMIKASEDVDDDD